MAKALTVLLGLGMYLLIVSSTQAQTQADTSRPFETQTSPVASTLIEPEQQDAKKELPDAPIPVLPSRSDAPLPCPAGDGKPCALLGGRLYFRDPLRMTQHDKTWVDALKNPLILGGLAVNIGTTAWLYRVARACVDSHQCRVGNPLLGQSRAQELTVTVGATALFYFMAAKLKQSGKGNVAVGLLAGASAAQAYQAILATRTYHRP